MGWGAILDKGGWGWGEAETQMGREHSPLNFPGLQSEQPCVPIHICQSLASFPTMMGRYRLNFDLEEILAHLHCFFWEFGHCHENRSEHTHGTAFPSAAVHTSTSIRNASGPGGGGPKQGAECVLPKLEI